MPVTGQQARWFANARGAMELEEYGEVVSIIRRFFLSWREAGSKEEVDSRWLDLWDKAHRYVLDFMSRSEAATLEEIVASVRIIDEAVFKLRVADEDKVVILLGAGASVPAPSSIPAVKDMLPELWRRAAKADREDLKELSRWCTKERITNIEDLLTAAYIANFSTKNRRVLALLNYFLSAREARSKPVASTENLASVALLQDTLQTLFGLLAGTMIAARPNPCHRALANFVKAHPSSTIVTTNYDGCMDQAIEEAGLACDYGLFGGATPTQVQPVSIVKMHGSINWSHCDSCQASKIFKLNDVQRAYDDDTLSFPVIGICRGCGGQRRPLVVPPLSFKFLMFPILAHAWEAAQSAFEGANVILVIGYSFAEADTYITKMIGRALGAGRKKHLILVDTNRKLATSLRERLSPHIAGFDAATVLQATDTCDAIIPKLCDSLLRREPRIVEAASAG